MLGLGLRFSLQRSLLPDPSQRSPAFVMLRLVHIHAKETLHLREDAKAPAPAPSCRLLGGIVNGATASRQVGSEWLNAGTPSRAGHRTFSADSGSPREPRGTTAAGRAVRAGAVAPCTIPQSLMMVARTGKQSGRRRRGAAESGAEPSRGTLSLFLRVRSRDTRQLTAGVWEG